MKNIVLIGMPASGKSTVGVLLAKSMGFRFIDTDLIIQENEQRLLQEIIDSDGLSAFCAAEERALLSVGERGGCVVATGGSAVYSAEGMRRLKQNGVVYYLSLPSGEIRSRLHNITTRGIAMRPDETIEQVFAERRALYEAYADFTVECGGLSAEQTVARIRSLHSENG